MEDKEIECVTPINSLPFLRTKDQLYVCEHVFNSTGPRLAACWNACIGIEDPAALRRELDDYKAAASAEAHAGDEAREESATLRTRLAEAEGLLKLAEDRMVANMRDDMRLVFGMTDEEATEEIDQDSIISRVRTFLHPSTGASK